MPGLNWMDGPNYADRCSGMLPLAVTPSQYRTNIVALQATLFPPHGRDMDMAAVNRGA